MKVNCNRYVVPYRNVKIVQIIIARCVPGITEENRPGSRGTLGGMDINRYFLCPTQNWCSQSFGIQYLSRTD